jgi:GDPmannose 4,6-dehydratase
MARALIVGSAGQDGTLLAQHLQARGDLVEGVTRAQRTTAEVRALVTAFMPDEVYYLAAYHHSSEDPPIEPVTLFARSYDVHDRSLVDFVDALRTEAPIFVAQSVLDQAQTIAPDTDDDTEKLKKWFEQLGPDELGKYKM